MPTCLDQLIYQPPCLYLTLCFPLCDEWTCAWISFSDSCNCILPPAALISHYWFTSLSTQTCDIHHHPPKEKKKFPLLVPIPISSLDIAPFLPTALYNNIPQMSSLYPLHILFGNHAKPAFIPTTPPTLFLGSPRTSTFQMKWSLPHPQITWILTFDTVPLSGNTFLYLVSLELFLLSVFLLLWSPILSLLCWIFLILPLNSKRGVPQN